MTIINDQPPDANIIEVGPGMPGDPSNYLPPYEIPEGMYDPVRETTNGGTNPGTTPDPGGTIPDNDTIIIVPGTDPRDDTDIGDGTVVNAPGGLDIVLREGILVAGGEQLTDVAYPIIVDQSGTDVSWENVASLISSGENTAITLASGETSNYIQLSAFDLDIPDGVVITGIKITINRTVLSGSVTESGQIYRCAVQQT